MNAPVRAVHARRAVLRCVDDKACTEGAKSLVMPSEMASQPTLTLPHSAWNGRMPWTNLIEVLCSKQLPRISLASYLMQHGLANNPVAVSAGEGTHQMVRAGCAPGWCLCCVLLRFDWIGYAWECGLRHPATLLVAYANNGYLQGSPASGIVAFPEIWQPGTGIGLTASLDKCEVYSPNALESAGVAALGISHPIKAAGTPIDSDEFVAELSNKSLVANCKVINSLTASPLKFQDKYLAHTLNPALFITQELTWATRPLFPRQLLA